VKIDGRDARELCSCLDRYLAGNDRALTPVRIPSEAEERARSLSRQRETLAKERKRLQNVGTSAGRYYGVELPANWWKPKVFSSLSEELPAFILDILGPCHAVLEVLDRQLREATAREERKANRPLPVGLGALTASVLDQGFVSYDRFCNRRQVGSYTGLCPGEASSGGKRRPGQHQQERQPADTAHVHRGGLADAPLPARLQARRQMEGENALGAFRPGQENGVFRRICG